MSSIPQTSTAEQPTTTTTVDSVLRAVTLSVLGVTLALVAFFVVLQVTQVYLYVHEPLDEMLYADIANIAVMGGAPFDAVWDIKPPVNTYVLAPFVAALGNSIQTIRIAVLAMNAVFAVLVTAVAWQVSKSGWVTGAAAFAGVLYGARAAFTDGWQPVQVMLVFSVAAMLVVIAGRGRTLWMLTGGVLLAWAFFTKQVIAPEGFAAVVFAAYFAPQGKRIRAAVLVVLGGLIGVGGFVLFWAWQGTLVSVWENAFVNSFFYAVEPGGNNWHFNDEFTDMFQRYFVGQSLPYLLPLLVMSVFAVPTLLRYRESRVVTLVVLVWLLMAVVGAMVGRSMRRTYFLQTVPPLIVLNAMALPYYLRLGRYWQTALAVVLAVALFRADIVRSPLRMWDDLTAITWRSADDNPILEEGTVQTVAALREYAAPEDCVWTWDTTGLYRYLAEVMPCAPDHAAHLMMVVESFDYRRIRAEHMNTLFEEQPTIHTRYATWGYFSELSRFADRYLGEKLFNGLEDYGSVDMASYTPRYASFGGYFEMIGYDLFTPQGICAGDDITSAVTWRGIETPPAYYNMFVHLLTADQLARVAGVDVRPHEKLPTTEWDYPNMLYLGDTVTFTVPEDTAPGTYLLVHGFYDPATVERVPVTDANGNPLPGDYILLTEITVEACDE
ncbi:MAG: hypothetical protein AAF787_17590 [Chloroflexota bacterium]